MRFPVEASWRNLSLSHQYMLASLMVLLSSTIVVGWWVGQEIASGVVHRSAITAALYAESFISPELQELAYRDTISPEHKAVLSGLMRDTPLGKQVVAFKVWDRSGRILFSTGPTASGLVFDMKPELARAWQGEVVAGISNLDDDENVVDRQEFGQLLEFYLPVRLEGTNRIISVAEFYQRSDSLQNEIGSAQRGSWLVVILAMLAAYLLLAGIVRRGSDTIDRQQADLRAKVVMLTELLAQNQELHERVRRAATRATELNEKFLRRISSELHDGPAQDLSLALLRLDSIAARSEEHAADGPPTSPTSPNGSQAAEDLETIQASLTRALQDVRAISTGLRLPELENLSLGEIVSRVVRVHERRTGSKVALVLDGVPEPVSMPVKITLYRMIQEALSNAYRHGGGVDQRVKVVWNEKEVTVEISDHGPGFDRSRVPGGGEHLGLIGMRERVESLGGVFRVDSQPGKGTRVIARVPAHSEDEELIPAAVGGAAK